MPLVTKCKATKALIFGKLLGSTLKVFWVTVDLGYWKTNIIHLGHKLIIEISTGNMVASCFEAQSFEPEKVGRFDWLVVDKLHRGRGLSMVITYEVRNALVQENFGKIELNTFEKMSDAFSMYSNWGWKNERAV